MLSSDLNEKGVRREWEKRVKFDGIKLSNLLKDSNGFSCFNLNSMMENPPALHDAQAEGDDLSGEEEVDNLI